MIVKIKITVERCGISMNQEFSYGHKLDILETSDLSKMILNNIHALEELVSASTKGPSL